MDNPEWFATTIANVKVGDTFRKEGARGTVTVTNERQSCDRHHPHLVTGVKPNESEGCWDNAGAVEVKA